MHDGSIRAATVLLLLALPVSPMAGPEGTAGSLAGQGAALDPQAVRDRVETYLGTIDTPITPAQWKALGPAAVPILEREAQAEGAFPTRRARAVEGLAALGGPGAGAVFARLAEDAKAPFVVRAAALRGEGCVLPPDRLIAAVRPVLESSRDPRVRGVAAEVLASKAPASGCDAVGAQATRETERDRTLFSRALETCRGR
jgi:hypothetical protein